MFCVPRYVGLFTSRSYSPSSTDLVECCVETAASYVEFSVVLRTTRFGCSVNFHYFSCGIKYVPSACTMPILVSFSEVKQSLDLMSLLSPDEVIALRYFCGAKIHRRL